jgi:hypothetical protein
MSDTGTELAVRVSRAITRRRFLERAMRTALVAGMSGTALILGAGSAEGSKCVYGHSGAWGNVCNPATAGCGGSNCSTGKCSGNARNRCDYWGRSVTATKPYCWCSDTCCHNGVRGHYVCCDCWVGGHSGDCLTGNGDTKCLCQHLHLTNNTCTGSC